MAVLICMTSVIGRKKETKNRNKMESPHRDMLQGKTATKTTTNPTQSDR